MTSTIRKISVILSLVVLSGFLISIPILILLSEPSIIGFTVTKAYVKGLEVEHECAAEFSEGWNLISVPCIAGNTSAANVFSSVAGNFSSIHAYYAEDLNDPWKAYKPGLPDWVVHDLKEISHRRGYWINMISHSSFYIEGFIIQPDEIGLMPGWNLIGYPTNSSKNITEALSQIESSFEIIWSYNASDSSFYYYNASQQNGTLEEMNPFYGYWINMKEGRTLFVI